MSAELAPRPQQARTAAARPTSLRPVLRALPQRVRQQQMGRLGFAILIAVSYTHLTLPTTPYV